MIPDLVYYCDTKRHLVCVPYTVENLHRMADDLGIRRCWYDCNTKHPHYDIPLHKLREVMSKCIVVRPRGILSIIKQQLIKVVDVPPGSMRMRKIRYRR